MTAVTLDSFMSTEDDFDTVKSSSPASAAPVPAQASILVVASQQAAADGSYQSLVTELSQQGQVEMHMFDRITEGGELLELSLVWAIQTRWISTELRKRSHSDGTVSERCLLGLYPLSTCSVTCTPSSLLPALSLAFRLADSASDPLTLARVNNNDTRLQP